MPVNTKPKILWVDDTPDEDGPWGASLRASIEGVLAGKYELLCAKNKQEALNLIAVDRDCAIRLVLLDIQFVEADGCSLPENQGQEIARELFDKRQKLLVRTTPEGLLKFLVLTHVGADGEQVYLGNQGCKIEHIIKGELADAEMRTYVGHLIAAIAVDFANNHLKIEWRPGDCRLDMTTTVGGTEMKKSMSIAPAHVDLISRSLAAPNESIAQGGATQAAKTVSELNAKIRRVTGGRVWGLLTRVNRGEVMAVIPSKNLKFVGSSSLAPTPTRMVTATQLSRTEAELKKALADSHAELAVLKRWKKDVSAWKAASEKSQADLASQVESLIRWQKEIIASQRKGRTKL